MCESNKQTIVCTQEDYDLTKALEAYSLSGNAIDQMFDLLNYLRGFGPPPLWDGYAPLTPQALRAIAEYLRQSADHLATREQRVETQQEGA